MRARVQAGSALNVLPYFGAPRSCMRLGVGPRTIVKIMKPLPAPHVPGKTEFERFDILSSILLP